MDELRPLACCNSFSYVISITQVNYGLKLSISQAQSWITIENGEIRIFIHGELRKSERLKLTEIWTKVSPKKLDLNMGLLIRLQQILCSNDFRVKLELRHRYSKANLTTYKSSQKLPFPRYDPPM